MKAGFIGLGIMGSRMAMNLLRNEVELAIHNRSKSKAVNLIEAGAKWFDRASDLASNCDVVFSMLSTPEVVEEMAFGIEGFVKKMQKDAIWVDSSTVNPSFSERMAKKSKDFGIKFLDAPVSGSLKPAENAELVFLVGGPEIEFKKLEKLFSYMGKASHYMGENGKGSATKMVVNSMLAQALIAFSEGSALGESLGIDKEKLFKILIGGPLTAPFVGLKEFNFLSGEFSTEFPLKWMHKDLYLASKSAYENNCTLPFLNAGKELYGGAKANGMGDMDMSAIYKFINKNLNNL